MPRPEAITEPFTMPRCLALRPTLSVLQAWGQDWRNSQIGHPPFFFKYNIYCLDGLIQNSFFSFWIWKFYTTEYKEEGTKTKLVILFMWHKPVLYTHVAAVFKFPLEKYEFYSYHCFLFNAGAEIIRINFFFLEEREERKETNAGWSVWTGIRFADLPQSCLGNCPMGPFWFVSQPWGERESNKNV